MADYKKVLAAQQKRLDKLETELIHLYFLKAEEIQEILDRFKDLPAEAFADMHKLLKQAKTKQSKFIVKAVLLEKNFPKIIDKAIYSKYLQLTDKIAKQEQQKQV